MRKVFWISKLLNNCCVKNAIATWPIVSLKALVRILAVVMKTLAAINVTAAVNWSMQLN